MFARFIAAVAAAPFLVGCATLWNAATSDEAKVRFTSDPTGAKVVFEDGASCKAPCDHVFPVVKEQRVDGRLGRQKRVRMLYRRMSYPAWANIAGGLVFGLIAFGVDYLSGAMWTYMDEHVAFEFEDESEDSKEGEEDDQGADQEDDDDTVKEEEETAPTPAPPPSVPELSERDKARQTAEQALPDTPAARQILEQFQGETLDRQIQNYYGGQSLEERVKTRHRLQHILLELFEQGEKPDIDEAVRIDHFRFP